MGDEEQAMIRPTAGEPVEEKKATKKETPPMVSFSQLFSFARTTRIKAFIVISFLFACVSGLVFPAMAFYFAVAFQDLATLDLGTIRELAFAFMGLGVIVLVSMTAQAALIELAATEMTFNLKTDWFRALLRQDLAYYDLNDAAAQGSIITNNAARYKKGMGTKLAHTIQFTLTFLGGLGYAFYSSWRISLAVLAVAPLISTSALFMLKMNTSVSSRAGASYANAGGIVNASISNIRTVLSLNAVDIMNARFREAISDAYKGVVGQLAWLGLANGCNLASMLVSYIVVTLYGSSLLYSNVRDTGCDPSGAFHPYNETCDPSGVDIFGALMGITFAAAVLPQVSSSVEALVAARAACYPAFLVMQRTLETPTKTTTASTSTATKSNSDTNDDQHGTIPLPEYRIDSSSTKGCTLESVQGELVFDKVNSSYPSRPQQQIFNRFPLRIPASKTVALVGFSGSGKSTVVQLLERFYDPTAGSITLDGVELSTLNVGWLRQQIAFVQQEPKLFECSIFENIRLGATTTTNSASVTMDDVQRAAKMANAHDFITTFPEGYDTQVGALGDQISGGQRQRVCIARCLINRPKILLLDEATSALDSESERTVQEALDALMQEQNMTTIVIAHRLSTIKNADVIAVVNEGTVVETGTHDELLKKKDHYYRLVQAQKTKVNMDDDDNNKNNNNAPAAVTESVRSRTNFFGMSNNTNNKKTTNASTTDNAETLIEFDNVHFSYPTRPDAPVFEGLNLQVKKGETLALVGASGCGKSTTIQLIECFYHPSQGTIRYKGLDLKQTNVRWLRDELGLVSQQPTLFDCTIEENIKYGMPHATHDQVVEAAKQANAHGFVTEFTDGYDTRVGPGSTLISGGQKQRICIARALLKKPKVLLLDEATSALDSESEKVVQAALDTLMMDKEQTCIVIAHRFSTIRNADRIAVVGSGKIQEIGTHEELMEKPDGLYRRLQTLQNLEALDFANQASNKKKDKTKHDDDPTTTTTTKTKDEMEMAKKQPNAAADDEEIDKKTASKNSKRARTLATSDVLMYFGIGALGAVVAGLVFPGWGFVFAFMIEVLYKVVEDCEGEGCSVLWNSIADDMKDQAMEVFYGLLGLVFACLGGFSLLFYGFGVGSERINKRVRDDSFQSMLRQEIGWFDTQSPGALASRLSDDAALLHSFVGEPIRTLFASLSSVAVGVVVAFIYMWPFALMTLGILPFMAFGAEAEMDMYYGKDESEDEKEDAKSPGGIVLEALSNIRTVASLTLEGNRAEIYEKALADEDPHPLLGILKKGKQLHLLFSPFCVCVCVCKMFLPFFCSLRITGSIAGLGQFW